MMVATEQFIKLAQTIKKRRIDLFKGSTCYSREEAAMRAFAAELQMKRLTPEAFFRIADRDQTQSISPSEFKEALETLKIKIERS